VTYIGFLVFAFVPHTVGNYNSTLRRRKACLSKVVISGQHVFEALVSINTRALLPRGSRIFRFYAPLSNRD
jgi:hypothetical protein